MNEVIVKILKKSNVFKYLSLSKRININGKNFEIPVVDNVGQSNLTTSEPWMVDVLKIISPIEDSRFVDIGVNTGQTLLKLKSVNSNMSYLGFEPNPHCISYLDKLVNRNNFHDVEIIPVGISNKTGLGVLSFYEDSISDSSASIIDGFRAENKIKNKEFVPLFKVSDFKNIINLDCISILKIDVEGSELEVIESFRERISKTQPIILLEILPAYDTSYRDRIKRQNKIQEILLGLNYHMFRVLKKNGALSGFEEIVGIEIHSDLEKCDYTMVPNSKLKEFQTITGVFS